jgi:hypothetical protein
VTRGKSFIDADFKHSLAPWLLRTIPENYVAAIATTGAA